MFQKARLIHGDELPMYGLTLEDFDMPYFSAYFQKRYGEHPENENQPLPRLLENMGLMKDDSLTVCGALLFAKEPCFKLSPYIVKAGAFDAINLGTNNYQDSRVQRAQAR